MQSDLRSLNRLRFKNRNQIIRSCQAPEIGNRLPSLFPASSENPLCPFSHLRSVTKRIRWCWGITESYRCHPSHLRGVTESYRSSPISGAYRTLPVPPLTPPGRYRISPVAPLTPLRRYRMLPEPLSHTSRALPSAARALQELTTQNLGAESVERAWVIPTLTGGRPPSVERGCFWAALGGSLGAFCRASATSA